MKRVHGLIQEPGERGQEMAVVQGHVARLPNDRPFLWSTTSSSSSAQVPVSLRNMIGRSFETQDAHDQIRAAILDLFEVMEVDAGADVSKVRPLSCSRSWANSLPGTLPCRFEPRSL